MARKDDGFVVEDKRPVLKNGKRVGTRVFFRNKSTDEYRTRVYLNPYGKAQKYALEIKDKRHYTNGGTPKDNKPWSKEAQAYRSGYLDARKDASAAWNSRNNRPHGTVR